MIIYIYMKFLLFSEIFKKPLGVIIIILSIIGILWTRTKTVEYGGNTGRKIIKIGDTISIFKFLFFIIAFAFVFLLLTALNHRKKKRH